MRRGGWWCVVPMFAPLLLPRSASGQTCGGAIDATVTIVDMAESGGVGLRVRTMAEEAFGRFAKHSSTGVAWPADTSIRVRHVAVRIETLPPPRDSSPRLMRITVIHLD